MCADVLDLWPDEQELYEFHHAVVRPHQPIFDPNGMYCPVRNCPALCKFLNLRDLQSHWRSVHIAMHQGFKCRICHRIFRDQARCRIHLKQVHKLCNNSEILDRNTLPTQIRNRQYINPGDTRLPRKGSKEEEQQLLENKKRTAQQDREEAARKSPAKMLYERSEAETIFNEVYRQ